MEEPFICAYYDSASDKNMDYYDSTNTYDSVADAMIEASNTISNRSEFDTREIIVKIIDIGELESGISD